jgi:hypothetical protein
VRAFDTHWGWYGPIVVQEKVVRKSLLGLAFQEGFELSLCQLETEIARRDVALVYADWLEERGHAFEAVCWRTGSDPADVLVYQGASWGLRRGRFARCPRFHAKRLRFPLLMPEEGPDPGQCYGSAPEAKADFLAAWA